MTTTRAKALWHDRDELVRCQAAREGRYHNDTPETDKQCCHTAKYVIEGKRFCAKHAEGRGASDTSGGTMKLISCDNCGVVSGRVRHREARRGEAGREGSGRKGGRMSVQILIVDGDTIRPMSDAEFNRRYCDPVVDTRLKSVVKDATVPKVGDIVRLNDTGLEQIFGRRLGLAHMKMLEMRVTHVGDVSMTYPEPTFCLEVDNEDINGYMIDNTCFDIVRRA